LRLLVVYTLLMNDVQPILEPAEGVERQAAQELFPLVYAELRQLAAKHLANEVAGQTFQATALVHEAYLRLVGPANAEGFANRSHFFGAAAEAMRRILINRARDKGRGKRGKGLNRVDLDHLAVADQATDEEVISLDEALQRLALLNPSCAELVKLRFFAGLTMQEAAVALGIAPRTAHRQWAFARAWLYDALRAD
jgi:RNA polymerase sigma factor (TIGR02999 family)